MWPSATDSSAGGSSTTTTSYGQDNAIKQAAVSGGVSGMLTYVYDRAGRMTNAGCNSYTYDAFDRIEKQVLTSSALCGTKGRTTSYPERGPLVVAQVVGHPGDGTDLLRPFSQGTMLTFPADLLDQVIEWQGDLDRILALSERAELRGTVVEDGVLAVSATSGAVRCWGQRDANDRLTALVCDFDPLTV